MNVTEDFKRDLLRAIEDTNHAVSLHISDFPRKCESWEPMGNKRECENRFAVFWRLRNEERIFGPLHGLDQVRGRERRFGAVKIE